MACIERLFKYFSRGNYKHCLQISAQRSEIKKFQLIATVHKYKLSSLAQLNLSFI